MRTAGFRAVSVAVVATAATLMLPVAPVWGHVSVTPRTAAAGATVDLAFSVPNEKPDAATVQVQVVFPPGIVQADAPTLPGWTSSVERPQGDVTSITWSRGRIEPNGTQAFTVTVALPDDSERLIFRALQTYSDGEVVRWFEEAQPGGPEPEHPAPVLEVTGAVVTTAPVTPTTAPVTPTTLDPGVIEDEDGLITPGRIFTGVGILIIVLLAFRSKQLNNRGR